MSDAEQSSSSPVEPSPSSAEQPPSSPVAAAAADVRVEVLLKPVADAPLMKQRKWTVDGSKTVAWITAFIRRYIKVDAAETVFVYVNQCFAPSADQTLGNLLDCFGADNKLVLHYARTQAWG